jgi:glutathionylspermidine synthase/uncharacterized membrane protein YjfL (UPF0719 family)
MVLQSLQGLPAFIAYFCLATVLVIAFLLIYTRITPMNEFELIRKNVPGAAIALGLSLFGFSLPLASAIAHASDLVDCAVWGVVAIIVQIIIVQPVILVQPVLQPRLIVKPAAIPRIQRTFAVAEPYVCAIGGAGNARRLRQYRPFYRGRSYVRRLMRRISCEERPDWCARAEEIGFDFHTLDGRRYWDERAYYAFTLEEIEQDLEAPTAELEEMSRELVARIIADERLMRRLAIPVRFWNWIARSWKKSEPSLYGRFDLRYGGDGPAKLLEYNADTRTSVLETGVFQWMWREQSVERKALPKDADQFNSLHERLIQGWTEIGKSRPLHLAAMMDSPEDAGTIAYLQDCAHQAGLATTVLPIEDVGRNSTGQFVDDDDRQIELLFKLYPWEWMTREAFGASLPGSATQFVEPPWKMVLSNKGILPLLWEMYPDHPNFASVLRRRSESGDTRRLLRSQTALFPRRRQYRTHSQRSRHGQGRRTIRG